MQITIGTIAPWDKMLSESYPNATGWDTPYAGDNVEILNDGRQFTSSGEFADPIIVTSGAMVPFKNSFVANAPKYPHGRIDSATFEEELLPTIESDADYLVLYVEGKADVPPGYENMTEKDPISTDLWPTVRATLVALTDDQGQADSVGAMLDTWWGKQNEAGNPKDLAKELRKYTK